LSASRVSSEGTCVYTSIVIAIWLCRMIRIAMRGLTSSAASKVAQMCLAS
jgi:hypothetical protein